PVEIGREADVGIAIVVRGEPELAALEGAHRLEEVLVVALEDDEIAQPLGARILAGDDGLGAALQLVERALVHREELEVVDELVPVVVRAEEVTDDALPGGGEPAEIERRDGLLAEQ